MEKQTEKVISKETKPANPNMVIPPKEKMTITIVVLGFLMIILLIVGIFIINAGYNDTEQVVTNTSDKEEWAEGAIVVLSILAIIYSVLVIVKAFIFDKRYVKATKPIDMTAGFISLFFGAGAIVAAILLNDDKFSADIKDVIAAGAAVVIVLLACAVAITAVNLTAIIINKKHPKKIWMRPKKEKVVKE